MTDARSLAAFVFGGCLVASCSESSDSDGGPAAGGATGLGTGGGFAFTGGGTATGGAASSAGGSGGMSIPGSSGSAGQAGSSGGSRPGSGGAVANGGAGGMNAGGSSGAASGGSDTGGSGVGGASAGGSNTGGSGAGDRCDVAVYDPNNPPRVREASGNLGTHDPSVVEEDGVFYELQTGGLQGLNGKTSTNLSSWNGTPAILSPNPSWIRSQVPEAANLWAPDLSFFNGLYHLYYSASSFGSNYSCIGHATRGSMASGNWSDQGAPTICSNHGSDDDWNAIDPDVVLDEEGTPWMSFGSFWSGIKMIELDERGDRANGDLHSIASRGGGAIEAPAIVRRCGYYYLFVSFDRCCDGANSTYNIRVGRSRNVTGPYEDKNRTPMMNGGGTLLVSGEGAWAAAGHNDVFFTGDRAYNVYHAYRASNGNPELRVAELVWDEDGWPISAGP